MDFQFLRNIRKSSEHSPLPQSGLVTLLLANHHYYKPLVDALVVSCLCVHIFMKRDTKNQMSWYW